MKISQINYALQVAKLGSFSAAAQKLFITQPTLSQQIRQLEQEIGTPLFVRNTRSVQLTRAGMEFLELAAPLIDNLDRLEESMKKYNSMVQGTLKIGLIWSFAYLHIDNMLNAFSHLYPDVTLNYVIGSSTSLLEQFKAHELDLIFINLQDLSAVNAYEASLILENPLCAVINKKHPLSHLERLYASNLSNENVLLPDLSTSIGKDITTWLKDISTSLHVIGRSSRVDVCMQIAASDLGISFASQRSASNICYEQLPIAAIPLEPKILRRTYLVYKKKELRNSLENTFISYCIKYYGNLG